MRDFLEPALWLCAWFGTAGLVTYLSNVRANRRAADFRRRVTNAEQAARPRRKDAA